jgi:hypothetical protein
MRSTLRIAFLATLIFAAGCSQYDRELMGDPEPEPAPAQTAEAVAPETEDSLGVGEFNELRYYGQWHYLEPYGWTWRPSVVSDWQPFMQGHWIWSQYGWMWVDYDPWGWATSHYGYWYNDFTLGWVWIPDYTWSPCQCDWLVYDDWISWAPVPPTGVRFKDPWEGGNAWVSVPVRRFKENDVGDFRATPKFKPENDGSNISRGAPDVREIERRGAKFGLTEVQLERRVVGEHEFAKVKYPAQQEQIIQNRRTLIKNNSTEAQFIPPTPASSGASDNNPIVGPPNNTPKTEPTAKAKDSKPANKDSGTKKETRYKDRKGDDGKSKDSKSGDSKSGKKKG